MQVTSPVSGFRRTLSSLNGDGAYGLTLAALCALLLLPEIGGDAARLHLRYERAALLAGEWWRLLTAHVIHLNLQHAALNTLGLILMWALFARDYAARQWPVIVLAAVAAIDVGLWLGDSTVEWYVGSSGVLHGVMAAGAFAHFRRREVDGWVLSAFLIGKLIYEQSTGALPFAGKEVAVVVDAHLYGAIGGLVAAIILKLRSDSL